MKWLLNDRHGYHNMLTLGLQNTDADTTAMLCDWADVILIPELGLTGDVPQQHLEKVRLLDIGRDVWGRVPHPDLSAKLSPLIARLVGEDA